MATTLPYLESIAVITIKSTENIAFSAEVLHKVVIDCSTILSSKNTSFDIKITFTQPIKAFRNHNYAWVAISQKRIANSFAPKVIQLEDGCYVQANCNHGIWEVNENAPNVLLWRFNPEWATPITHYTGAINTKKITAAHSILEIDEDLALLFTQNHPIELSRSPIPFAAIACFTDHCDFDTAENLKIQRVFFKSNNIKITKGFFLNHFSKRDENASIENQAAEIGQWQQEGHELCYHSLTQSIRDNASAFAEFRHFTPPYTKIPVWIDHGFQPYNFSLFEKNEISSTEYENTLTSKGISVLWNYVDCANATTAMINQLNPDQFNLEYYYNAIKGQPFLKRSISLVKNIIFHYDNDEFRVRNYIESITHSKNIINKCKVQEIFSLIKNISPIVRMLLKVLFTWNTSKKQTYKAAQYSPLFFKHTIDKKEFYIFQTIEMLDFTTALCSDNVNILIEESGVFIAHTYFSVDMAHYLGKLINSDTSLNEIAVANFDYLSQKVKEKTIWNPTLSELLTFYKKFQETIFDIDEKGFIFIKNNSTIPSRTI